MRLRSILVLAVIAGSPSAVQAAKVELKGTHLCCGGCVKIVAATLKKVEGVSNPACDREAKTITFEAEDRKIALKGLRRLTNAGFYGKASIDGTAAKLPSSR